MFKLLVSALIIFSHTIASAQIVERICPGADDKLQAAEAERISNLIRARCQSPWYDKYGRRLQSYYEGVKAPLTLNGEYFGTRVVRYGLSKDAYDILAFDGLDDVLKECYPDSLAKRIMFRQSLITEETYSILGVATVAVAGYLTVRYTRGKLKSIGWLPLSEAAKKIGMNEKWLRMIVYGSGVLAGSFAWQYYNQIGDVSGPVRLDRVTDDIDGAKKVAERTGTLVEEVQLNRLKEQCVRSVQDSLALPEDIGAADNRDYVCGEYLDYGRKVITMLDDKFDECDGEKMSDLELARTRIEKQLQSTIEDLQLHKLLLTFE